MSLTRDLLRFALPVFRAGFASIEPATAMLIGGGISALGGIIGGSSAASAQRQANRISQQQAAEANRINQEQFNLSRGVAPGGGAVNTMLPSWATIGGQPAEQALFNRLLTTSMGGQDVSIEALTPQLMEEFPGLAAEHNRVRGIGDSRTFSQWLNDFLRENPASGEAQRINQIVQDAQTTASEQATQLPDWLQQQQQQLRDMSGNVLGGGFLNEELGYLGDVADVRNRLAAIERDRIDQGRDASREILSAEIDGLERILNERIAGSGGILDAETEAAAAMLQERLALEDDLFGTRNRGAQGMFDASTEAAEGLFGAREAGSGGILDAETEAAAAMLQERLALEEDLFGTRNRGAQGMFDAGTEAAEGLFGAREAGARGIYDADLLGAQVADQAAERAVARAMSEQQALRARQGFSSASSGGDLLRARILADAFQGSAAQRSDAERQLAMRMAAAGEGRAGDLGTAGVNLAQLLGLSDEQRAIGMGTSRVENAGLLGQAGIGQATRMAGAGEADALGRMQSRSEDARRRALLLDADADAAMASAGLQNELDRLGALRTDQGRRLGAVSLPGDIFSREVAAESMQAGRQFSDLDQILGRLGTFTIGPTPQPGYQMPNIQPVINAGQIAGGALSSIGSGVMDYFSTKQIIDALNKQNTPSVSSQGYPALQGFNFNQGLSGQPVSSGLFQNNRIFGGN
jgi:hypothetical protein